MESERHSGSPRPIRLGGVFAVIHNGKNSMRSFDGLHWHFDLFTRC